MASPGASNRLDRCRHRHVPDCAPRRNCCGKPDLGSLRPVRHYYLCRTPGAGLLPLESQKDTLPWAASAAAFLILGTVAFFSYQILSLRWTADYSGDRVVVGSTFTQEAADYLKAHPTLTNADLINHYTGKIQKIWTRQSIDMRRILLAGIYVLTMPLFAICIISLLQAIHCATIEKPRKRRRDPPAVAVT